MILKIEYRNTFFKCKNYFLSDVSHCSEVKVDEETAKMVENLKVRLKTLDDDLERVKSAALKIHKELNHETINEFATNNVPSSANSFVCNNQIYEVKDGDLRMSAKEWYDPGSLLSLF